MTISQDTLTRLALAMQSDGAANEITTLLGSISTGTIPDNPATIGLDGGDVLILGYLERSITNGITAATTQTQAAATALVRDFNRVSTVATAGNGVRLPASVAGKEIVVFNDTANAMQVYGASTDTIDGIATATGISQGAGAVTVYRCFVAGNWVALLVLPATQSKSNVAGTAALASLDMEGSQFNVLTLSGQGAVTKTTRTAAQIQANVPNWKVGQTYLLRVVNNNTDTLTFTGGSNVTMTSTVPAGYYADYIVSFATATTVTATQISKAPSATLPYAKFTTSAASGATATAGDITGAAFVNLTLTANGANAYTTRTATQMFGDITGAYVGMSYMLRIRSSGDNTVTLTAPGAGGVTITGTATIATTTARLFCVTFTSATAVTFQDLGVN